MTYRLRAVLTLSILPPGKWTCTVPLSHLWMAEHCFFPSHANNDNKNSREKLGTTKQIREKHKTLCLAKTSIQAWEATILTNYSYTRRGILEQNPLVTLRKHNPWTQRIFYIFIVWLNKWNYWMWWSSLDRTGFIFVCYAPPVTQKVGKFHFPPKSWLLKF